MLLDKIKTHFSEAMYEDFTKRRFGIKSCLITEDPFYLNDLMMIYIRELEMQTCPTPTDLSNCCNLNTIEETIKTL